MKFDDILEEIGEFGLHQKKIFFLVCFNMVPPAFHIMAGVFTLGEPSHRCALPGLDNDTYKSQGHWHDQLVSMAVPKDDECKLYQKANGSNIFTNETESCNKWVYSKDPFESTFVSEIDLICDDVQMKTYANMIMMGGLLFGSAILGSLADVIGRRKVILISGAGTLAASLANAFVKTYIPFVILRFLTAFFVVGMMLTGFVVAVEIVGPRKRKITGLVFGFFWVFGLFIEVGIAYGLRDWTHFQIAISVPIAVLLLAFFFFLPESPRWLINKGKYKEASRILQDIAKGNGVTLTEKDLDLENIELEGKGEQIWHMFTVPVLLIRSLIIFFNWFVASLVYYGLSLNVGNLSGDLYLNFFLAELVELAAYIACLILLDVAGRKLIQCVSMLIGGVACICTLFPVIYDGPEEITITLSLVGKFGASAAFAVIYVFAAELFPTIMRNSGIGLSSFWARVGGILAPYIADIGNLITGDFAIALPLLIFGGASILAGLLALLLPETVNRKLPDTVEDARNFGKTPGKHSYTPDEFSSEDNVGKYNPSFITENQF